MYVLVLCLYFFFFKQKTAYEMRISDWSSDVCSSDLRLPIRRKKPTAIILGGAPASPPVLLWRAADMPRAPSWRLDAAHYPVRGDFQTRFQDMDVNGHLNNVAIATLFESGRVFLNAQVQPLTERPSNERRSEEHTSELQSPMPSTYAVFSLQKKKTNT